MRIFRNIRAVCFDVGNTLLRPYPSTGTVMSEVLLRFGWQIPPAHLDAEMGVFDRYYAQEYERDESFWSEEARQREMWINGFAQVCRAVGVDRQIAEIAEACYDEFDAGARWQLFKGTEATLEELRRRGYRLAVISNWGAGLEELLRSVGLGSYFEVVTASAAAGVHKPLPGAFHLTLDRLGVLPEEAVHVGDHPTADVEGSAAVGMHPVLVRLDEGENFDPTVDVASGVGEVPVITALPQLLELLPEVAGE
ncbi:MAG: HAD-IA family hydrolase [Coriobacteriia bacterium]|nr:HAD-IA family hydrolase [Coriobacteriia bacterium]